MKYGDWVFEANLPFEVHKPLLDDSTETRRGTNVFSDSYVPLFKEHPLCVPWLLFDSLFFLRCVVLDLLCLIRWAFKGFVQVFWGSNWFWGPDWFWGLLFIRTCIWRRTSSSSTSSPSSPVTSSKISSSSSAWHFDLWTYELKHLKTKHFAIILPVHLYFEKTIFVG